MAFDPFFTCILLLLGNILIFVYFLTMSRKDIQINQATLTSTKYNFTCNFFSIFFFSIYTNTKQTYQRFREEIKNMPFSER